MRHPVLAVLLAATCAASAAAQQAPNEEQRRRNSTVVTTTPLEESAPIEVNTKEERSKEREYCMRLFTEPEFVRSCIRNRTWRR